MKKLQIVSLAFSLFALGFVIHSNILITKRLAIVNKMLAAQREQWNEGIPFPPQKANDTQLQLVEWHLSFDNVSIPLEETASATISEGRKIMLKSNLLDGTEYGGRYGKGDAYPERPTPPLVKKLLSVHGVATVDIIDFGILIEFSEGYSWYNHSMQEKIDAVLGDEKVADMEGNGTIYLNREMKMGQRYEDPILPSQTKSQPVL